MRPLRRERGIQFGNSRSLRIDFMKTFDRITPWEMFSKKCYLIQLLGFSNERGRRFEN